jgi:hypothetical protein
MSRLQWCREHIDQVAEACDLSRTTVLEVKEASKFCDSNVEFSTLPTSAILTLIRVKDEDIKARAVSLAQNALNISTPTGGKKNKGLTAKDIKKIIDIACTEIRMERPTENPHNAQPEPEPAPIKPIALPAPMDAGKLNRERMEVLAVELLSLFSQSTQTAVADIMREHPSYKVKDVFYFGIQSLVEQKKK